MKRSTRTSLAIVATVVVALGAGYIGAGLRGGGSSAVAATGSKSWIEDVKSSGELRIGVAIAPPMTVQDGEDLGGPNLIPAQHLADSLGVKLVKVPASWNNIVAGLQADRYDLAANLDATLDRSLSIQFTDPIYEYQGVFVVPADSALSTSEAIIASGQPVAVAQGSAPAAAVAGAGAQALELTDYTGTLQALKAGRAVAEFADLPTAEAQAQADPTVKIVVPDPEIYAANAGYGVTPSIDPSSLQVINIAIATARASGELERAYLKVNYRPIDQLGDLQKQG